MKNEILLKGYTLVSEDGVFVRLEETIERDQIVISLLRDKNVETARLTKEQFNAFSDLRYSFSFKEKDQKEGEDASS